VTSANVVSVEVPDIGDFEDVPIIEILVSPGDHVGLDEPLLTLESDKATMDVPAPFAGVVRELHVKVGDRVSQGTLLLVLEPAEAAAAVPSMASAAGSDGAPTEAAAPDALTSALAAEPPGAPEPAGAAPTPSGDGSEPVYASPSVRRSPVSFASR